MIAHYLGVAATAIALRDYKLKVHRIASISSLTDCTQFTNVIGTTAAETLFGSKYVVVVVVVAAADGGTAFRPEVSRVVADLTRDLANVPGVKAYTLLTPTAEPARAISGTEAGMKVEPLLRNPNDAREIANLARLFEQNPVYQNPLISADKPWHR